MSKIKLKPSLRILLILGAATVLSFITVISLAYTSQDKPDLNVKVRSFRPREFVKDPTNITIIFSRNLVPDDSLNVLFSDVPLKITPPLPGLAKWIDNNMLRYFPDSTFLPSTEYNIRIVSDKTYLYGNRINESKIFKFRTPNIAVKNTKTEIINIPDPLFESKLLIHLTFNYPVSINELLDNFSTTFTKDGRPIKFSCDQKQSSSEITLSSEPFDQKKVHGRFTIKINKGLVCAGGTVPLGFNYTKQIHIPKPQPLVVSHVRSSGAGKNCRISLSLSQSVALSELKDYVTITPSIDFTIDQYYNRITLRGDFKPRETYTINIRKGLRSLNGQPLERDFSSKIKIDDFKPSIGFVDDGVYMPQKGRQLLEIETMNVEDITVEVQQVFINNIVYYLSGRDRGYYGRDINRVGKRIFHKDFQLPESLNKPLTSTIDIGSIVGDTLRGIYNVSARLKNRRWTNGQRQVMITDLGILARKSENYLMVWINSLSDTKPVKNAIVRLMSRNNQVLAEGETDKDGVAIFENLKEKTKGFNPFLVTVEKGKDLSYLRFNEGLISTSEFDIKGRPYLTKGYESFIYSDRDVYRPGEQVHLIITTREKNGILPPEFPYMLEIKDPRGLEYLKFKLSTKDSGISSIDLDIQSFAETGGYVVLAKIGDNIIGRYGFQVEEFVPDRIKTSVNTDKTIYNIGDTLLIDVNGEYFFGPPCAGNNVSAHVTIERDYFQPKVWPAFSFSNPDINFASIDSDLPGERLDDEGKHSYRYQIPIGLKPPSSLKMLVSATIKEDGGRAVSDYKELKINPYPFYVGVKKDFNRFVKQGETASFSIVTVDFTGKRVPVDTCWAKLYRTIYQTIVQRDRNGNYKYVSKAQDQLLDSVFVTGQTQPASAGFTLNEYGAYKVLVECKGTEHTASQPFYVSGWGYSSWSMSNPDRIEMNLDKKYYSINDKAKLLIKAPFDGKLLLTIEKERVLEYHTYTLDSNTAEIIIPTLLKYAPNVYVTATLIKSTTSLERHSPSRAYGMILLMIDNSEKELRLSLEAPSIIKPRQKITVKLNSDAKKGAKFTVAVVDVGILRLTDFSVPDPFDYFHGKRSPALNPFDIYSIIFPDIEVAGTLLSPAGDAYRSERKRHLNPITARRVKPLALWSGLLEIDINGQGEITFDIPQFNGKLSVAAVVIDGDRFGAVSKEIVVRDKIVIQESLPRFISPGDKLNARFVVFNNTGKSDNIDLELKITDHQEFVSEAQKGIYLDKGERGNIAFNYIAPEKPGKLIFEISAKAGNEMSSETIELPNRPPQPLLTEHGSGVVEDGKPAKIVMPEKWLEGTAEYRLRVSSLPAIRFSNSIQYLLRYPYGCIEQTTSKIMPLLYFNDLAKIVEPEIFGTKGHEYFIQEGIAKISGMQKPSGAFQYWPNWSGYYPWASVYASHALVEARKAGYWVSDNVYDKMINFLKKTVRDINLQQGNEVVRIYAAYVLALAGELEKSSINSFNKLDIYSLPLYSRFQFAGAIAMTMGVDEAQWLLPVDIHPLKYEPSTGGFFDSDIRANAILIETLCDIAPDHPSLPVLVKETAEKLYLGRWYSTQSNGFALMAMGKYYKQQIEPDYTGLVVIDGKKFASFTINDTSFMISPDFDKNIEISINGTGRCYYFWQASGVSSDRFIREFDNSLMVRREYLDSKGKPLSLTSVSLGDQIVVKITGETLANSLENVVINDLLPACMEIENPRLKTAGNLNWIPRKEYNIDYMDIRDDRLLLFLGLKKNEKFEHYYLVRVISSGIFTVPPIAAECMYDPTIASSASSGTITVSND